MKKLFILLSALVATVAVQAQDNLVVKNVTVPQGGSVTVEVELNNPDHTFVGATLALTLPEGIHACQYLDEDDGKYYPVSDGSDRLAGHDLMGSLQDNGARYALFSGKSAAFKGTSGVLFSFDIEADATLEIGKEYTATLFENTFSAKEIEIVNNEETIKNYDVVLDDVTFTITIGEPDDGYIKFNETATKLPKYTAGENGNVRMTRSIKAGQWSTIVLPFTLSKEKAEAAFGSDVEFAEFAGFEVDYGDDEDNVVPLGITINFSTYTLGAKKLLTGGKPFLIKTLQDITTFEAEDVKLTNAVTDVTKTDEWNTSGVFTGTLVKTTVPEDGLFLSENKFWYSTGATAIKAFRGWFELGAVLDKETTDFGVKMAFIDGVATRINEVNPATNGSIYDLSGRKVNRAQKGVYVIDGKKVIK